MTLIRVPALAVLAVIATLVGVDARLARAQPFELPVRLVRDINPGALDSAPLSPTNVNGTLFFRATDGVTGAELWKSDGTAAGTVLVRDINPGAASSSPSFLDQRQRHPVLRRHDAGHRLRALEERRDGRRHRHRQGHQPGSPQLWPAGPHQRRTAPCSSPPRRGTGRELWKSDGTAAGTVLVKDINPGAPARSPAT